MAKFKLHNVTNGFLKNASTQMMKHFNVTVGICFVVIGVILLSFSYIASLESNYILYIGLFLIILGIVGYVHGLKNEL